MGWRCGSPNITINTIAPYGCTFPHEVASKAIGRNNGHMTVNMLKADMESARELKHDIASPLESKSFEEIDSVQCGNCPSSRSYKDIKDFIKVYQNESKYMEDSLSLAAGKIGLPRKLAYFYTEETVTEVELPEKITCFTNGACNSVVDICIDEESHSLEKVLGVESNDHEVSSRFDHSASDVDNTKEMAEGSEPTSHGFEPSSINEHPVSLTDEGGKEQCSSGSSLIVGGKSDLMAPSEAIREKEVLPLQDLDDYPGKVDFSSFNCVKDQEQTTFKQKIDPVLSDPQGTMEQGNSTTKVVPSLDSLVQAAQSRDINHGLGLGAFGPDPSVLGLGQITIISAAEEAILSKGTKGIPVNGEVGIVNIHCDSGVATVSGSEESKGDKNQHSGIGLYISKYEEAVVDGASASARSSFVHHGHLDLSEPIVSSGHIPYSGSISLRSDSSTTSARSFAFPILQSDWISSPVKMAEADRRRLRRHRGWRMGLLCCKF